MTVTRLFAIVRLSVHLCFVTPKTGSVTSKPKKPNSRLAVVTVLHRYLQLRCSLTDTITWTESVDVKYLLSTLGGKMGKMSARCETTKAEIQSAAEMINEQSQHELLVFVRMQAAGTLCFMTIPTCITNRDTPRVNQRLSQTGLLYPALHLERGGWPIHFMTATVTHPPTHPPAMQECEENHWILLTEELCDKQRLINERDFSSEAVTPSFRLSLSWCEDGLFLKCKNTSNNRGCHFKCSVNCRNKKKL